VICTLKGACYTQQEHVVALMCNANQTYTGPLPPPSPLQRTWRAFRQVGKGNAAAVEAVSGGNADLLMDQLDQVGSTEMSWS
jgi:hypothetical protein